ncbi:hypothetical protein [Marilutibacter maris]|uniref:hypothetical protein n=1 Tax=Marilutibacter maris TaxID=1605891 RepID=UPI001CB8B1AF|nr:hypothetical protein [Lysobacter maris]
MLPDPPLEDIKSSGSEALTTPGLADFKCLLEKARRQHDEIVHELSHWRAQELVAVCKHTKWRNGWLFRRLFKQRFQKLYEMAEESMARRAELEEQERLSRLQTQLNIPDGVKQAFHRLCDEFSIMSRSHYVWDTIGQRSTDRVAERTAATRTIDRKPVGLQLGRCEVIDSAWDVPHFENANGGDIYFYPAFVLYFVTPDSFALLEYSEIKLRFEFTKFIEEEVTPSDSRVVGITWAKTNKNGTPDKRFKDNYQIDVLQYGTIAISSATGMNEEYMISNSESAHNFAEAWQSLASAVQAGL